MIVFDQVGEEFDDVSACRIAISWTFGGWETGGSGSCKDDNRHGGRLLCGEEGKHIHGVNDFKRERDIK